MQGLNALPVSHGCVQAQVSGTEPDSVLKDGGSSTGGRVLVRGGAAHVAFVPCCLC